jgi:hypothetical protein
VSDKSLVDSLEGTVAWEYDSMACRQMKVQLYKGLMKVYTNQSGYMKEALQLWSTKTRTKQQDWNHQAYKMHIKNIAIFMQNDDWVEVARDRFTDKGDNIQWAPKV